MNSAPPRAKCRSLARQVHRIGMKHTAKVAEEHLISLG